LVHVEPDILRRPLQGWIGVVFWIAVAAAGAGVVRALLAIRK
jgi:hypothetical protein